MTGDKLYYSDYVFNCQCCDYMLTCLRIFNKWSWKKNPAMEREREMFLGKGCISAVIITETLLWSRFKCPSVCKWSSFCRKNPNQPKNPKPN